jgi:hypothetical protein
MNDFNVNYLHSLFIHGNVFYDGEGDKVQLFWNKEIAKFIFKNKLYSDSNLQKLLQSLCNNQELFIECYELVFKDMDEKEIIQQINKLKTDYNDEISIKITMYFYSFAMDKMKASQNILKNAESFITKILENYESKKLEFYIDNSKTLNLLLIKLLNERIGLKVFEKYYDDINRDMTMATEEEIRKENANESKSYYFRNNKKSFKKTLEELNQGIKKFKNKASIQPENNLSYAIHLLKTKLLELKDKFVGNNYKSEF